MNDRKRDRLDNRKHLVRELYKSGLTDTEIADEMGVTRSAVGQWRKRNGLSRNSRKGRVYATWHHRAALLLAKGWTLEAVVEHVNRPRDTVQRTLRRMKESNR